jgi:hypothetical protein
MQVMGREEKAVGSRAGAVGLGTVCIYGLGLACLAHDDE